MKNDLSDIEKNNINTMRLFFKEVWNNKKTDNLQKFMSPELTSHFEHETIKGITDWKEQFYDTLIEAIPDINLDIKAITESGENIITRWVAKGTHRGALFGINPTGEFIQFSGISWSRFIKGRMVETWNNWDMSYLLNKALSEVDALRGIIPLCLFCKKIRDDKGYWEQVDVYIQKYSDADISHSICPKCMKKHYPDVCIE